MESDRGFAWSRVDTVEGLLALGADTVAVSVVVVHAYSIRSGVRCYWVVREEKGLIGLVGGSG